MDLIEATGLVKRYKRRGSWLDPGHTVTAVADVDLRLTAGEVFGVIGESGSGKSTLGRLLIGMERPDAGSIALGGRDLWSMTRSDRRAVRRAVQIVFQDPFSSLDPRMNVAAIIAEPIQATSSLSKAGIAGRVEKALAEVGLDPAAGRRFPHEFSGGQRQRIAIARAIAVEPSYLILDEPISSLDVSVGAQILELLERIRAAHGAGYLIISHNLAHVRNVAQRVAVMREGRIVEVGPVDEVFVHPRHAYTTELLSAVPRLAVAQT